MANVPTYMMFDDHEVTDDWFLDADWRNAVLATPLGKRVITNGLLAYFLCQGWGNDPAVFDLPFVEAAQQLLDNRDQHVEFLLNHNWSYLAPTQPPALVMDTRTQRSGVGTQMQLLNDAAFTRLGELLDQADRAPDQPLFVVSPAPVFGLPVMEGMQRMFAPLLGHKTLDFEGWFADAFTRLLQFFPQHNVREVVFLSGDIHYALNACAFTRQLSVYQLVSSSLKNSSHSMRSSVGRLLSWRQLAVTALRVRCRGFCAEQTRELQFWWKLIKMQGPQGAWRIRPKYLVGDTNAGRIRIHARHIEHQLLGPDQPTWTATLPRPDNHLKPGYGIL